MKQGKRHILIDIIGYFLLLLGIIGFLLPIIPQWPFIILGILVLGKNHQVVKKLVSKLPESVKKRLKVKN